MDTWNIDLIIYFVKIAELKNITAAANELYVTQPTLTHQMQKIESRLGITLYNRLRNGIVLTPEGEQFYQICKKLLAAYEEFNSAAYLINNNVVGTLKIGYPKSGTDMLLKHNSNFVREYPNTFVKNFRQGKQNGIDLLLNGELDFFYLHRVEMEGLPSSLRYISVGFNPYMVLMSADNPLAKRKSIHISELKSMRFVMPSEVHASGRITLLNKCCRENGFIPNIVNYHHQQSEYVLDIMTYPDIVTIQPRIRNVEIEYNNKVVYVPLEGYPAEDEICLTWLNSNPNPLIKLYTSLVSKTIKAERESL